MPQSVIPFDTHYVEAGRCSAYLVVEGERAAFVDTNTEHALPHFLAALESAGLAPEQVAYLILTHVHLDHAAGTSALLAACPNATVLAHPKAARHAINPERLVAGATMIYGEQAMQQLYGTVEGVPEERVRTIADGEEIEWGARTLRFLHTRGHATHHMCIHDPASDTVFTGDAFGIGRSESGEGPITYIWCSSPPTEFEPDEALASVDRIVATGATHAAMAHFGQAVPLTGFAEPLRDSIRVHAAVSDEAFAKGIEGAELHSFAFEELTRRQREGLIAQGVRDVDAALEWLSGDRLLNAMGIATRNARLKKTQANA